MNDAAAVRSRLLDALRLDLVGPRPGEPGHDAYTEEVLPVAPSRWYLTGFLVPYEDEPARIQAGYEVRAQRVEPVGLVYLWPVSG